MNANHKAGERERGEGSGEWGREEGGGEGESGGGVRDGGSESSSASVGVALALGGLRELEVFLAQHEPSKVLQHRADGVGDLPL